MSAFLEALKRELDSIRADNAAEDERERLGLYGWYPSMTVTFNASKHRNSELAWVLNTQNHEAKWPLWWTRGAAQ